ncbi:MAG: 4-hydroxybutyrate--acetyl-CoA CoA transferase [Clostridiales bacterium]|nr:4-hydroxybutyrate--acetyl-CoA CoA transferase [Candidatus Cacconaster stercorequi]
MNKFQQEYNSKKMSPRELLGLIQSRDFIFTAQAAAAPRAIMDELQVLKETGVSDIVLQSCVPTGDFAFFHDPEMSKVLTHHGWFMSPSLRKANEEHMVSAVPQSSTSILRKTLDRVAYEKRRPVVLTTVSPMDERGYMTLSISAIYEMDLIKKGAIVLAEVNPNYPRTFGDTLVHISQITALVESDRPIPAFDPAPYTEVDATIGKYVASLVEDGSTIQLGIGNIPNAVANELKNKKHLGIHTEMFTETMVDLIECGAVDNSQKGFNDGYSIASFTMGSQRLYHFLHNNPTVHFKSCTFANDPYTIGRNNKFVSINATLEMDLTGQAASESVGPVQFSGTGGQSETVQGAQMSKGGKSILAMHSTYTDKEGKLHSKIVPMLTQGAAVTTSRNDVDYVVTEYGIAWLRGLTISERVEALVSIAHPDFRQWLRDEAKKNHIW